MLELHRIRLLAGSVLLSAAAAQPALAGGFTLTILHHNDGESQLIDAGDGLEDFGGVARFATVVDNLRTQGNAETDGVVLVTSGDNFLAGPEFAVSLDSGIPYFDAIAMDMIGYDAIAIGNHEFDFGPQVLANFINSFTLTTPPFLSANLDVSPNAALQPLALSGRIAESMIIVRGGTQIGIIGATTPLLSSISSPGNVVIEDVVTEVQAQVNALQLMGVDKIILISHLQSVQEDLDLIPMLSGIDVAIAGGGDELLANPGDLLVPDDAVDADMNGTPDAVFGSYPLTATDLNGDTVRVITGKGGYRYVGQLIITFDASGDIISVDPDSGPVRVAGGTEPDAVAANSTIQTQVVDPIIAALADLDSTIVATNDVALDGRRTEVRSRETNLGNLIADAYIWQAIDLADEYGVPAAQVAITNSGGIRNDSILNPGDLSVLDTFDVLPFGNFLTVMPAVTPETLLDVIENAVAHIDPPAGFPSGGTGRFAQIAGAEIVYVSSNNPGMRVRSIILDDGTPIVQNFAVAPGAPSVTVASIDFLARGGDEYPFGETEFVNLGLSYQQVLQNYLEEGLDGMVTAAQYPLGGEGRIVELNPDFNDDDAVNIFDLLNLLAGWGCGNCPQDINKDGVTDALDLLELLSLWG